MNIRIFNLQWAPKAEADGVMAALEDADIPFYTTSWSEGLDPNVESIWARSKEDAIQARAVIDMFQAQWRNAARGDI